MKRIILDKLSALFCQMLTPWGTSKPIVRSDGYISDVYVVINKQYALQMEVIWREGTLFMYLVFLQDGILPGNDIIYRYKNGQWCRKYLEEIYHVKSSKVRSRKPNNTSEGMFALLDFYSQLIEQRPEVLSEAMEEKNVPSA